MVIDAIQMDEIKTKSFQQFLKAVDCDCKALVVTAQADQNVVKSARNIPGVQTTISGVLSPYDILNAGWFIVDEAALREIEEVYA